MKMHKKRFYSTFPHLAKEIENQEHKLPINSNLVDEEPFEEHGSKDLRNFNPNVIDFLRRCNNEEEAIEIINYLEKKREISPGRADMLKKRLKKHGLKSFGLKKKDGYYLKNIR